MLMEAGLLPFLASLAVGLDRRPLLVAQYEGLDLRHRGERAGDLIGSHGAIFSICACLSHQVDFDFRPVRPVRRNLQVKPPALDSRFDRVHGFPLASLIPVLSGISPSPPE